MPRHGNLVSLEAEGRITPLGGMVASRKGELSISLPAGAVAAPATLIVHDRLHPDLTRPGGSGVQTLVAFDVDMRDGAGRQIPGQLNGEVTITIDFDRVPLPDIIPQSLTFFTLDENTGRWEPVPSQVDLAGKKLVARTRHFSGWAAGGDANVALVPTVEVAQTSLFTRSAEVAIDLKVPPGHIGFVPKLQLRYSSNAINRIGSKYDSDYVNAQSSWVGIGWSLDLGAVTTRYKDTGYDLHAISFAGNADRILEKQGSNRWYLQREQFVKITQETTPTQHWVAIGKDGTKYRFGFDAGSPDTQAGGTTGSRQEGAYVFTGDGKPRTFMHRWLLDQIEDTQGNIIKISYEGTRASLTAGGETRWYDRSVYPREIIWNDRLSEKRFKVVFNRTEGGRQDIPSNASTYETAVLDSVEMFVNTSVPYDPVNWQRARRYQLNQSWLPLTTNSGSGGTRYHLVLNSLQEFGSDNSTSLPAWSFTYEKRFLRVNGSTNINEMPFLKEATNGYGGKVTFAYDVVASYDVGGTWNDTARWHAITTRTVYDGRTDSSNAPLYQQQSYSGTNAHFSFAENAQRPDFRGFNVVTVADAQNQNVAEEHRFFQGTYDTTTRSRGDGSTVTDSEGLVGLEYEARWLDGGAEQRKQWTDYHQATWPCLVVNPPGENPDDNVYFSVPNSIREYQGARSSKKTFTYENTYGNWLDMWEYASAGDANWYRHTWRGFATSPNTADWIVGKPNCVNVYAWDGSPNGAWKSTTAYYYDGNTLLPPTSPTQWGYDVAVQKPANVRAVRRGWDDQGTLKYADTFHQYDTYGNKIKEEVARSWGTYTAWGSDNVITQWKDENDAPGYDYTYRVFPKRVYNPLGQRTTYDFDPKWGKPAAVTDPNGQVTSYAYDKFGRVRAEAKPQDTLEQELGTGYYFKATVEHVYYDASPFQLQTRRRKVASGPGSSEYHITHTFYDGLGREIQRHGDGLYSQRICSNTYYSNRGLKRRESVPHAISPTSGFDETDWKNWFTNGGSYPGTDYSYDALRRPTRVTNPDVDSYSQRTYRETAYRGWEITSTDEKRHQRKQTMDAFGRLVRVDEYQSTFSLPNPDAVPYATTDYVYDVLDNLTTLTDAGSPTRNVTTIVYDNLSRKKQMTDPDMGTWSYAYDADGNLTQQTDAKGQSIAHTYDALGRLARKYYAMSWVDDIITTAQRPNVYDLIELRSAVDADRMAAGVSPNPYAWNDPAVVAGKDVPIRAVHFTDLRSAIQGLWSAAGIGSVPEFTNGAIVAGTRLIKAGDPLDLRAWLVSASPNNYESSAWAQQNGRRARVAYRYDSYGDGTNRGYPLGRRTEMWDISVRTRWTYDQRGRIITEERWIDGQLYSTQWTYDAMDRVMTMTYPDGEVVIYAYNVQLLLSSLSGSVVGTIVDNLAYNAMDLPVQADLSNTVADLYLRYRYHALDYGSDNWPYGGLWDIRLMRGDFTNLLRLEHKYDYVGNVSRIVETPNTQDYTYEYDDLDRLLKRKITGGADQETFGYNQIGNLMSKSGVNYSYGAKPHAATVAGSQTYEYDGNGNMTRRGSQHLKYDAENRVVKVSTDISGTQHVARFAYDGDGKRAKRVDDNGTIHYVGGHYERNVGNGVDTTEKVSKYYYATLGPVARLIALRKSGTLYYVCTDHLGGTTRITDTSTRRTSRPSS